MGKWWEVTTNGIITGIFHDHQLDTGVSWSHLDVFFGPQLQLDTSMGGKNKRFLVTSMKTPWLWRLWVSMSPVRNGSMKCDQLVMKIRVTGDLFYLSVQKHVCGFWFDPKVWKLCQLMFIFNLKKCMKWWKLFQVKPWWGCFCWSCRAIGRCGFLPLWQLDDRSVACADI